MSVKTPNSHESTDPRPTYFALGVDGDGAHHTYATRTHEVHAVDGGERTHRIDLGEKTLDEYMGFVDAKRGWQKRRYGRSMVDVLVEAFEEADDGE